MKYNKRIKGLIFEMVTLISVVIGTFFIWQNLDCSEQAKIAYAYSNYDAYLTLNINKDTIDINNNESLVLSIGNSNSITKSYNLYFIYDNTSELNKDYIELEFDNKLLNLNELEKSEKGNFTYYILKKDSIKKKSTKNVDVKILLADNTPSSVLGNSASIKFDIEEI